METLRAFVYGVTSDGEKFGQEIIEMECPCKFTRNKKFDADTQRFYKRVNSAVLSGWSVQLSVVEEIGK